MLLDAGERFLNDISIRALDPDEWQMLRAFRLQALKSSLGAFAMSHDECASWTEDAWRAEIAAPAHQIFGLFDRQKLIGITAAFTWRGDPSGRTALLAMSYIEPEYRGRGLSNTLYEARLDWIRRSGRFRKVHVSHRASNQASRRANQRHGFVRTGSAPFTWPDGTTEDEVHYELTLEKHKEN
jgi:RimJ/RimL family protein N-acetyltransferase